MRGVTLPRIRLHDLRHSSILVTLDVYSHLTQHQILILTAVRDRPAQPNSRPPHVAYGGPQPATVNWSGRIGLSWGRRRVRGDDRGGVRDRGGVDVTRGEEPLLDTDSSDYGRPETSRWDGEDHG
jgi:hypothetical protein